MSKFRVGDHVIVVPTSNWPSQVGMTGTVTSIYDGRTLPIEVTYDCQKRHFRPGNINSYSEDDLALTELGQSPLWQALR